MDFNEKAIPKQGESMQTIIDLEEQITDPRFDESAYFDAEIKPVVQKLIELCKPKKIPFICGVNFANIEEKGNGICFVAGMPGQRTPMQFRLFTDAMQDESHDTLRAMMIGAAMFRAAGNRKKDGE